MRMITKEEECCGRFSDKEYAADRARLETEHTGKKHIPFLSHYNCPYDHIDKMYWGIIVKLDT